MQPSEVHWIIGTAGHIDHGKTSLIKALTGEDTDRLKEEKERGISIDLGFAHLDLPGGVRAGVVDVPGHERFIRNMLAGAHGIDLVLFTVAADDGVKPQTEEHLDILHLLGVSRAIFVITKADRVAPARIDEVEAEIRALIAGTALEGSPAMPFSFITGDGLDSIRARIANLLRVATRSRRGGYFRLPIDRVFVSAGHGVIVTGTAVGGEVRIGDSVRSVPGGHVLRVRGLEVHNEPVQAAGWGQRLAINLTGADRADLARGDVICDDAVALISSRIDVRLEVRPRAASGIKDHQRIRVHLGTAERLAKAIPIGTRDNPRTDRIAAGETAYCQIVLDEPIHALRGDRFIVRDETAERTLGGGAVIRPDAPKHKRSAPGLVSMLEAFDGGDEIAIVRALIEDSSEFVVSLDRVAQIANVREEEVRSRLQASGDVHMFETGGDIPVALEGDVLRVKASLVERLRGWHAANPLSPGIGLEEARAALAATVPANMFRALVDELEVGGDLVREGSVLRLQGHRVKVPEQDRAIAERITALLARTPLAPPDVRQLADELGLEPRRVSELLRAMEKQRAVVGVGPDLYFLGDCVDRVRDDLIRQLSDGGAVTTAEFRDQYRTSRKYAIPLLEYFDREGITTRTGEARRLKRPPIR